MASVKIGINSRGGFKRLTSGNRIQSIFYLLRPKSRTRSPYLFISVLLVREIQFFCAKSIYNENTSVFPYMCVRFVCVRECLCLFLPSVNNYKHSVNFHKNQSRLGNSDDRAVFVRLDLLHVIGLE